MKIRLNEPPDYLPIVLLSTLEIFFLKLYLNVKLVGIIPGFKIIS